MTYRFLVRGIELTIWAEGPYNPKKAISALMVEYEITNKIEIVFLGTTGCFIPNLQQRKIK